MYWGTDFENWWQYLPALIGVRKDSVCCIDPKILKSQCPSIFTMHGYYIKDFGEMVASRDFLELFFEFGVAAGLVGVVLDREFAVGDFDLRIACSPRHAQHLRATATPLPKAVVDSLATLLSAVQRCTACLM